ncbi:MAG: hypothetical protein KGI98_09730, partial [Euryarchaeota archaeon]|nr:hypothetical protein [Euryarchaeota archaeon]
MIRRPTLWLALALAFASLAILVAGGTFGSTDLRSTSEVALLPTAAHLSPASASGASPSSLGSFSTPYGSFNLPQGGCTTGLNGTCPHLTPSISASPSKICRSGATGCGGVPYDTKVTLTVNATGTT